MAGRDIARRTDADQAQPRAARMRFVDALMQLGERVADVGESMMLAAQREFQIFVGKHAELIQHAIHAALVDRIQTIRRCRDRRESDLVKAEVVLQMAKDPNNVRDPRGEGHPRRNGPRLVILISARTRGSMMS